MLTARSVVIAAITIAVLSIIGTCISLLAPPGSGGLGGDTYGTREHGQQALFDILAELDVPVERLLLPPTAVLDRRITLVFWNPHPSLVQLEPVYLQSVADWVRNGGRVIVAPSTSETPPFGPMLLQRSEFKRPFETILEALGLSKVRVRNVDADVSTDERPVLRRDRQVRAGRPEPKNFEEFRDALKDVWTPESVPMHTIAVQAAGRLSFLNGLVSSLQVPLTGLQVVDTEATKPSGRLTFKTGDGTEQTLAATYRVGQGEVVVVGDPSLAENRSIARNDNSVLAVQLTAGAGLPVVFDEFYHGLTIRGRPLWLFTRRAYAVVALTLLTVIGLWVWQQAVFLGPPLESANKSRRTIAEYIEATSRFLNRGRSSRPFLLRQLREGVLWKLRHDLGLPPGEERPEYILAALNRRDPERAERLAGALRLVDETLEKRRHSSEKATVQALQRISACL